MSLRTLPARSQACKQGDLRSEARRRSTALQGALEAGSLHAGCRYPACLTRLSLEGDLSCSLLCSNMLTTATCLKMFAKGVDAASNLLSKLQVRIFTFKHGVWALGTSTGVHR